MFLVRIGDFLATASGFVSANTILRHETFVQGNADARPIGRANAAVVFADLLEDSQRLGHHRLFEPVEAQVPQPQSQLNGLADGVGWPRRYGVEPETASG